MVDLTLEQVQPSSSDSVDFEIVSKESQDADSSEVSGAQGTTGSVYSQDADNSTIAGVQSAIGAVEAQDADAATATGARQTGASVSAQDADVATAEITTPSGVRLLRNLRAERDGVWVQVLWDEFGYGGEGVRLYRSLRSDPEWPTDYGEIADLDTTTDEYYDPLAGGTVISYALIGYDSNTETPPLFYEFDPCDEEEITDELARGLPDFFPNGGSSGNYHLLEGAGHALKCNEVDLDVVEAISTVQDARTKEELQLLGALINTPPRGEEGLEVYRARLEGEYAKLTSEGTIQDLISSASQILEIDPENIGYLEAPDTDAGVVQIGIPGSALDEHELTETELVEIFEGLIAGSYEITATRSGTFTYITPSDYESDNHDPSLGYDTAVDGEPDGSGGTYSGVI